MIDCCNAQLQIPKGPFEHKREDHIVFITKMVHVMFHETAAPKITRFSHFNPYMSNGVSQFNLLDELITLS